ncbi:MAG: hypothetical protein ABII23_07450 [bacterium]
MISVKFVSFKKLIAVCLSLSFLITQIRPASAMYKPTYLAPPMIHDMFAQYSAQPDQSEEAEISAIIKAGIKPHLDNAVKLARSRDLNQTDIKLLKTAAKGIEKILKKQLDDKLIQPRDCAKGLKNCIHHLADWLSDPYKEDVTKKGIRIAIDKELWEFLSYSYFDEMAFGTAGIRGKFALGDDFALIVNAALKKQGLLAPILKGPNIFNDEVVKRFTAAVTKYFIQIKKDSGGKAEDVTFAIGRDCRTAGGEFADLMKKIGLAYGVKVFICDEALPLPEFSCAIKELDINYGIYVSASHNAKEFNGLKIIGAKGAQLGANIEVRNAVIEVVNQTTTEEVVKELDNLPAEIRDDRIVFMGGNAQLPKDEQEVDYGRHEIKDTHSLHVNAVKRHIKDLAVIAEHGNDITVGYCSFFGAGRKSMPRLLKELKAGKVECIESMMTLDGTFPGLEVPDPGLVDSWKVAFKKYFEEDKKSEDDLAEQDLWLSNDPDADRFGLVVRVSADEISDNEKVNDAMGIAWVLSPELQKKYGFGGFRVVTANEWGALITWYDLMKAKEKGGGVIPNADNKFVGMSHVTSDGIRRVALKEGIRVETKPVGVDQLAALIEEEEKKGNENISSIEESGTYATGNHILDKDGFLAGVRCFEIACYARSQGKTIGDLLNDIAVDPEVGLFPGANVPLEFEVSIPGYSKRTEIVRWLHKKLMPLIIKKAEAGTPFIVAGEKLLDADAQEDFQSHKYDKILNYKGFPDAGIRIYFDEDKLKYITIRPSGTEAKIRFYVQLFDGNATKEDLAKRKIELYTHIIEVVEQWQGIAQSRMDLKVLEDSQASWEIKYNQPEYRLDLISKEGSRSIEAYFDDKVNSKKDVSRVEAAEIIAKAANQYDEERGAARALKDEPARGKKPALIAAAFGIDEDDNVQNDIKTLKGFYKRHNIYGKDAKDVLTQLECTGEGGQRNLSGMLARLVRLFKNRVILIYSGFNAPFKETARETLKILKRKHKDLKTPKAKLQLLMDRKESAKLLILAASKSGTTLETMVGFQHQVKESIRLYYEFVYGDSGVTSAEHMIKKLYNIEKFLTGAESVKDLNRDERMMLAIVLDRVILPTGEYKTEGRKEAEEGRARVGASMFDCFAQAVSKELEEEFTALGNPDGVSTVRVYDRQGGRTNILGPDAFARLEAAMADGKTDRLREIVDEVRSIVEYHNNTDNRSLWGKKMAALAHTMGAESLYIGLPTTIEHVVVEALQQLVGESIDVGALVGHAAGMKPVVHPTTVLAKTSLFRNDDGKRLSLLGTDKLADKATKEAEETIIKREEAKGNRVVRIEIEDHSPASIAKFMYEMLDFVEWYGNFLTADMLANLTTPKYKGIVDYMCSEECLEKVKKAYPDEADNITQLTRNDIKNIDFSSPRIDQIIATLYADKPLRKQEPTYFKALRLVVKDYNVWYQPGVEWGKTAAKKLAEEWCVSRKETVTDPVSGKQVEVVIRDEKQMQSFYQDEENRLHANKEAYIVDGRVHERANGKYQEVEIGIEGALKINVTGKSSLQDVVNQMEYIEKLKAKQNELVDTINRKGNIKREKRRRAHDKLQSQIEKAEKKLRKIACQVECNEQTAQQLGRIGFEKHKEGMSNNVSLYASRQRLEAYGFQDLVRMLEMFDTFQYSPDQQHTDADGVVAGTKTAFQILTHVREKVTDEDERVVADGMVAPYWNGLCDKDLSYLNNRAYAQVYRDQEIDFVDLRVEGTTLENIAKMYVLFAQANRVYLDFNNALGKAGQANPVATSEAETVRGTLSAQ